MNIYFTELKKLQVNFSFNPWTVMFTIGGLGYIIPAIFFWFFGSAKIQKWNEIVVLNNNNNENNDHVTSIHMSNPAGNASVQNEHTKL